MMEVRNKKHQLDVFKDIRITAIGGGHGLGRLMSTLSFMKRRLVGIVATTDNGGSTGKLRAENHCIAWGDIRNCMSQLANQPLAAEVLNYRFSADSDLQGHSLGNLLLYCLDELSARPLDGIDLLSRLLKVSNRILPMSETPTDLAAEVSAELTCFGELYVDQLQSMPKRVSLSPAVQATPEVLFHLQQSDYIILGPGSFLTSVLPPLLVAEIAQTIENSPAKVIFIDNLVAEPSPAGQLSLSARIQWLEQQLGRQLIDIVISPENADLDFALPVIHGVTADPELAHRHHTESLLNALREAVEWLSTNKTPCRISESMPS